MSVIAKGSGYYLAGFLNACVMASLMPVLSLYAYRYLDATATQLSTLLGGYALSSIMYAFFIARIVERVGKHKHWLIGISFLAAGALVVLANTQNYLVACVVMLGVFAPFHASTALLMGLAFRYFAEIHQPKLQRALIKNSDLLDEKKNVKNHLGQYLHLLPPLVFFALLSFAINLYQHILPVYFVQQALPVNLVGTLFMCAAIAEIVLIVRCVDLL